MFLGLYWNKMQLLPPPPISLSPLTLLFLLLLLLFNILNVYLVFVFFSSFSITTKRNVILGYIARETTTHRTADDRARFGSWGLTKSSLAVPEEYQWGKYIQWHNISTTNTNDTVNHAASIRCPLIQTTIIAANLKEYNAGGTFAHAFTDTVSGGHEKEGLVLRQRETVFSQWPINKNVDILRSFFCLL